MPAAAGLEKCQRHDRREADDRAEVGDDVEGAQDESDEETKFQADECEADREEHAEDKADEHLTAKKGFYDDDKFSDEKHDIRAQVRVKEGQVIAELSGGLATGEEKEKQINRHDGQVSEEGEEAEGTAAGGLERGDREGSHAFDLGAERIGNFLDGGVGKLAFRKFHPLRIMILHVDGRSGRVVRKVGHEGERLLDHWRKNEYECAAHAEGKDTVEQHDGGRATQAEASLGKFDDGAENQCEHAGHGQGPDHAGKEADELTEHHEGADQQGDDAEQGEKREREGGEATLRGSQKMGGGLGGHTDKGAGSGSGGQFFCV